jgi:hypothetical protein
VAPLVYFVIYVSILVQADGLGQTLARFQAELDKLPEERRQHEMTTTTDLAFVNLYLRTSNSRMVTFLTWSIFVIAFFAIPLTIMLLFQVNFLPYKHDWLSYYHMTLVAVTTGLSVFFWFRYRPALRLHGRKTLLSNVLLVALPVAGSLLASSSALIFVPEQSWIDTNVGASLLGDARSKISRSLNLRGLAIGDKSKGVTIKERNLSNADFSGARLTNVEFINLTALDGAEFQRAVMRNVRFTCRDDSYDEFDLADCSVDAVDMSGAILHGVQMEGLTFGYLNLRSTIIAKSRLAVAATVTDLEGSKVWGSILGDAEKYNDKSHRTIGWAYLGHTMLRESTLYVDGAVSGLHRLSFAVKTTLATDTADVSPAALAATRQQGLPREPKDGGQLFFAEYFNNSDIVNEQRRWDLAFEPYEANALFFLADENKAKGTETGGTTKEEEAGDTSVAAPCQPQRSSAPGSLSSCVGKFGYDVKKKQPVSAHDFKKLLKSAEDACSSANPGTVLATNVTSFLSPALLEQVTGRELTVLARVLFPTEKSQRETAEQFEKRKQSSHKQADDLLAAKGAQVAELTDIWSTFSNSPCLCERLSAVGSYTIGRIAGNLSVLKGGAQVATRELTCGSKLAAP